MSENCDCGKPKTAEPAEKQCGCIPPHPPKPDFVCTLPDCSKFGNVYFKGCWEYCPEYKIGDLVFHNGILNLCLKPHAGKEPKKENKEYWYPINGLMPPPIPPGRIYLDGGFATTRADDCFKEEFEIDGGASNGRVFKPLICDD